MTDPERVFNTMTSTSTVSNGGLGLRSQMTDENDDVPNSYLSSDESLNEYTEFVTAGWIDTIYVPLCAGLGIIGNVLSLCVLLSSRKSRSSTYTNMATLALNRLGIIGNVLSLCVLLSPRMSRSSTYIYMATLAVTDSLVQVTNILFLVRKFPGHEVMVKGTCGLIFFLLYFSLHSNVVVMITMTAERYLAIRFPLKAMRWFTARRAKQAVAGVLLLTLLLNVHHLVIRRMTWNDYLKEDICTLTGSSQQIHTYGLVWPWIDGSIYCFIPFISLVVFNILIVKHMRQSRKFRWSNTRQSSDNSTRQGDPNRQITMMLLMVTCAFLVLVGPVAAMLLVERYLWIRTSPREKAVYHLVRTILNNLSYTNHAINFLLYCLSGNRFRQEFIRLFCTRSSCRSSREEQQLRRGNSLNADRTSPVISLTHSLTSYTFTDQSVPSLNGGTPGTFSHI